MVLGAEIQFRCTGRCEVSENDLNEIKYSVLKLGISRF